MKRKIAILLFLLSLNTIGFGQQRTLLGGHPECICTDGKKLFITNIGKELLPSKKDEDGFISKVSFDMKIEQENILDPEVTLHAPKGCKIVKNVLYVTDIDQVVGIDLSSGKKVFEYSFDTNTKFLNDIEVRGKNWLYVSSTDKNVIYELNLRRKKKKILVHGSSINGVNGLFYNPKDKQLYAVGFGINDQPNGKLGEINFEDRGITISHIFTYTQLYQGRLDGVQKSGDKIYFTDWVNFEKEGKLLYYDLKDFQIKEVPFPEKLSGPADFLIVGNTIYIPEMLSGTLFKSSL